MLPSNFIKKFESKLAALYSCSTTLNEAISYALLGPGKRLRPQLAYLSALELGAEKDRESVFEMALPAMLSVEMTHCYSLVHDDLPAMDNDDYRRGRLSCHKKYGEALGILVGDALIADAFSVLSTAQVEPLAQIRELALAIGSSGMVLGQHEDLTIEPGNSEIEMWLRIHMLKTGRLFECACVMGAMSVGANSQSIKLLREFAREFGIAFQLRDDLKDDSTMVKLFGSEAVVTMLNQKIERAKNIASDLQSLGLSQIALDLIK